METFTLYYCRNLTVCESVRVFWFRSRYALFKWLTEMEKSYCSGGASDLRRSVQSMKGLINELA